MVMLDIKMGFTLVRYDFLAQSRDPLPHSFVHIFIVVCRIFLDYTRLNMNSHSISFTAPTKKKRERERRTE